MSHVLTLMTFVPLLGAFIILFIPRDNKEMVRAIAVAATGIPLLLAVKVCVDFYTGGIYSAGFPMHRNMAYYFSIPWIQQFNINYTVGVDGMSAPMVILTALISFICVFASWNIKKGVKGYFLLFLILETGMMGVFCALDFFLFYVFWEVMLLPMYFLIGIWGGPRKEYAAIKFFIYTLVGSVLMLVVMIILYFHNGQTFDLLQLSAMKGGSFSHLVRVLMYVGLFIGFAIKVPVWPFHTWLPDAHVEAPTAISVILAAVLLKMGIYGILRISFPIFPDIAHETFLFLAALGAINIVYGALCAMAQTDLKKLVAYSSVSHMGFCLLGMASMTVAGMTGTVVQMVAHGLLTGMLFLLVGVVYDRAHHRNIDGFGGLWTQMPVYTGFVVVAFFGSMGLPGLCGFIGEMLCFVGGFQGSQWSHVMTYITLISMTGIILTAGYLLWTVQRMFFGPLNKKYVGLADISKREIFTLVPLGVLALFIGIWPSFLLKILSGYNVLERVLNSIVNAV